jgi:hypothetical protein
LYLKGSRLKLDFRKKELGKRGYLFLPQLNINPMKERELGLGNRNRGLIEGVFLRKKADPEGWFCFDKA